eukprot:CAMPEP_0197247900 /NCGR_PEP_ID=MMETSP1429-20130617/32555_1 /TAXON_ID=49237 /ORGANISM="Chaetoceros  sp., Strain UNC1202" /LENGTH=129 /DNA_ID=CAMNT_0042708947 /DNA_START=86 /DNA_END=472 /DNA_ORIENTATION=-
MEDDGKELKIAHKKIDGDNGVATSMATDDDNETESDSNLCPLFMDGLPSDFSTNPDLAAIASLIGDDDEDDKHREPRKSIYGKSTLQKGGGKVVSRKERSKHRNKPYATPKKKEKQASLGEAQLFLKMW